MQALCDFLPDKDNRLAGVHFSEDNLRTFAEDGAIPSAILDAIVPVADKNNTIANARSTHAHGNRKPETNPTASTVSSNDDGGHSGRPEGQEGDADDDDGDGRVPAAFIIEASSVMPTAKVIAKSDHYKPSRLRNLQKTMNKTSGAVPSNRTVEASLGHRENAEAAAAAGRAQPVLGHNPHRQHGLRLLRPSPFPWSVS